MIDRSVVSYVVFAQATQARLPLVRLLDHARRFFALELNVLAESENSARIELEFGELGGRFTLESSEVTPELLERARRAETAGKAAGMASLAARCAWVWRVVPETEVADRLLFKLCALLASVALGPVLPPDDSTLFGVRGANERAQKA